MTMSNKTMMAVFVLFATALVILTSAAERKQPLLGGHRPMDLTNEENKKKVDSLVEFALTELAARRTKELKNQALTTNENPDTVKPLAYKAVALKGDVKTQVVAGMNYNFKIRMRDANCQDGDNCPQEECEMTVWEKPWENFRQLTHVECKKKSNVVGGKRKISVKSLDAQRALAHAVMKLNSESNDLFYMKPVKISKVYKQVVNGIKYTIMFTMGRTECKKNNAEKLLTHSELTECSLATPEGASKNLGQERFCKIEVLDQPWMEKKVEGTTKASRYTVMNSECFN